VGHTFVSTDDDQRALCIFRVADGDSIAEVNGSCA
jgi:hypothetical protein